MVTHPRPRPMMAFQGATPPATPQQTILTAAVAVPYYQVMQPPDTQPDRPIGYGAFGVVWWVLPLHSIVTHVLLWGSTNAWSFEHMNVIFQGSPPATQFVFSWLVWSHREAVFSSKHQSDVVNGLRFSLRQTIWDKPEKERNLFVYLSAVRFAHRRDAEAVLDFFVWKANSWLVSCQLFGFWGRQSNQERHEAHLDGFLPSLARGGRGHVRACVGDWPAARVLITAAPLFVFDFLY